jgi:hypothetical protein
LPSPSPPRCPATAHVVETRVGAGIRNGTETPPPGGRYQSGYKDSSPRLSKIKHPVLIHTHRVFKNPPLFYITLVLKKSNTKSWYTTMVLKKIKYQVLIYNRGSPMFLKKIQIPA